MSEKFVKIPFGEKGMIYGFYILNTDLIKHMEYYKINEAMPKSTVVEQVPYLTVHYGDGRQAYTFNEEQAKLLFECIRLDWGVEHASCTKTEITKEV